MGGGLHHIFHFRVKSLDRQKKHRSVENFELLHVLFDRTTYPPPRKLITGLMQITGPLPAALEGPGPRSPHHGYANGLPVTYKACFTVTNFC